MTEEKLSAHEIKASLLELVIRLNGTEDSSAKKELVAKIIEYNNKLRKTPRYPGYYNNRGQLNPIYSTN